MPRIAQFDGIVIAMYFGDHNPPHFHARHQGSEALFEIETSALIEGYLPGPQQRAVREWAEANREMLREKWAALQ